MHTCITLQISQYTALHMNVSTELHTNPTTDLTIHSSAHECKYRTLHSDHYRTHNTQLCIWMWILNSTPIPLQNLQYTAPHMNIHWKCRTPHIDLTQISLQTIQYTAYKCMQVCQHYTFTCTIMYTCSKVKKIIKINMISSSILWSLERFHEEFMPQIVFLKKR